VLILAEFNSAGHYFLLKEKKQPSSAAGHVELGKGLATIRGLGGWATPGAVVVAYLRFEAGSKPYYCWALPKRGRYTIPNYARIVAYLAYLRIKDGGSLLRSFCLIFKQSKRKARGRWLSPPFGIAGKKGRGSG